MTNKQFIKLTEYDCISSTSNKNGYFVVYKNDLAGIIDSKNNIIIPCMYDYINLPNGNYCEACKNNKFGLIDLQNNIIIPFEYDKLGNYLPDCLTAKIGNKSGFIDINNNKLSEFKFEDELFCANNRYYACLNGKWGVVDKYGNIVVPIIYKDPIGLNKELNHD